MVELTSQHERMVELKSQQVRMVELKSQQVRMVDLMSQLKLRLSECNFSSPLAGRKSYSKCDLVGATFQILHSLKSVLLQ